jgi:hypothetical protein
MQAAQQDQPITSMTLRELRALIAEEVREQMADAIEKELQGYPQEPDPQKATEAIRWLRHHRWTPPPGSPTTFEMIRQGRD